MRFSCNQNSGIERSSQELLGRLRPELRLAGAFTLFEVLITVALMLVLIASSFSALMFMNRTSASLSSNVAVMAAVQGEIEKVRALTYNPPGTYFKSTTTLLTNNQAIFLAKSGTNLLVPGTVVAKIQPTGTNVGAGHLVTVTGTFATPGRPTVVTLQTIVNKFSGGQQQ